MNNISRYLFLAAVIFYAGGSFMAQEKLSSYVNPFIGTDAHGHTYPGASLPFGMVQLSPDTDIEGWDWCSGYHYSDNSIMGFSHTHLSGTGVGDYGDILIMPFTGEVKTTAGLKKNPDEGYRSRFSHNNETAKAGYYSVLLDDYKIKAELTVTKRTGFHKYTFPKTDKANIIIDLVHGIQDKATDTEIKIINDRTVQGYRRSTGWANNHCVYFYAEFSKTFTGSSLWEKGVLSSTKKESKSDSLKLVLHFSTEQNEPVMIRIGISHTSPEGAKKNLEAENSSWDFDKIRGQAEQEWEKELSAVKVESKSNDNKSIFYTALYHSLLNPNTLSDADGSYIGMNGKIINRKNEDVYTVFSLWDTFRALHPLFTIVDEEKAVEMVNTLIYKYEEHGLLPVWELASNETGTMIGYHSIPVIADVYFKGLKGFDVEKAFEAMKKSAMQDHLGLKFYKEMGYIPSDLESESVSKTLEYAYDDWCIAQMAKDLNKTKDYNYFIERSKFYVNVFDPSSSLMRAKKNGRWYEPFDPYSVSGNYTEANAWQYSFFVPHDVNGLMNLIGGDDKFTAKLDELFTTSSELTGRHQSDITGLIGQYAHGNEPSHHMAYLYNYAGAPSKTQERIHEILKTMYSNKPDGLSGNEDCGQMSAWYVFSSMGFYPVCPGDNRYIIGTPLFEKVSIKKSDGKYFNITARNLSDENKYIQSCTVDGKEHPYSYIRHSDIRTANELVFEMGPNPSKWGTDQKSRPHSSVDFTFVPVPYLKTGERVFKDSLTLTLAAINDSLKIYYTIDNSDPLKNKNVYTDPILINKTTTLKAVSASASMQTGKEMYSKIVTAAFNKIPEGINIKISSKYHSSYTGGGELGLIDGVKGNSNFHTDAWQGYEGVDLDAVIDLGEVKELSKISASFLQNTRSWIFFPESIEYYTSTDGENFKKVYSTENPADEKNSGESIKSFDKELEGVEARYVKLFAKNIGTCPPWHVGAGGKAWIFIDEVTVE